jgi:hypothetical protein
MAGAQPCFDPQAPVTAGAGGTHLDACDVDGDGQVDLISVNPGTNTVLVLRNRGDRSFSMPVAYPVGIDPEAVSCADLNGDHAPDLAVTNEDTNNASVLMNAGDGTFLGQVTYGVGSKPREIAAADLDGDEDLDLAIVMRGLNSVAVLTNSGSGTFTGDFESHAQMLCSTGGATTAEITAASRLVCHARSRIASEL